VHSELTRALADARIAELRRDRVAAKPRAAAKPRRDRGRRDRAGDDRRRG
jgi:hypothetical protein